MKISKLFESKQVGDVVNFEIPYFNTTFKFQGKILKIDKGVATISYSTGVGGKLTTMQTDIPLNKIK